MILAAMLKKILLPAFLLFFSITTYAQQSLNDRLLEAVKQNNLDQVKDLVDQGADVNYTDSNNAPVLMWAAYKADLKMVKYLVGKGADYTRKGIIDLGDGGYYGNLTGIAAGEGNLKMLKFLIEDCGVDINDKEVDPDGIIQEDAWTAIIWSVSHTNSKIFKYLIKKGSACNWSFELENKEIISLLKNAVSRNPELINQQNAFGQSLLVRLIKENNLKRTSKILNENAKLNISDKWGYSPLHYAVILNKTNWVKELINHGADVNIKDNYSKSPLFYSLENEKNDLLNILLKYNPAVDTYDKNAKPFIFYAIDKNNLKMIDCCLNNGVSIDIIGPYGRTPLLYALFIHNVQLASYFIEKGGDITIKDINGQSATDQIYCRNYKSIIDKFPKSENENNKGTNIPVKLRISLGTPDYVNSIDITSDDKYLLCNSKSSIILYDLISKKEIRTFCNQESEISYSSFFPNDSLICAVSFNQICIWDIYSGDLIRSINYDQLIDPGRAFRTSFNYMLSEITSLMVLPDNNSLLVGYGNEYTTDNGIQRSNVSEGSFYIIDVQNEEVVKKIDVLDRMVYDLEQSRDNKYILAVYDSSLIVFESLGLKMIFQISFNDTEVSSAHFSTDNKYIITYNSDSTFRIYKIDSGELLREIKTSEYFSTFKLSPTSKIIACASKNKVLIWDNYWFDNIIDTIKCSIGAGWYINFFNKSDGLALSNSDNIYLVNFTSGQNKSMSTQNNFMLSAIDINKESNDIIIGSRKYSPIYWDMRTGIIHKTSDVNNFVTQDIRYIKSDGQILCTGPSNKDGNKNPIMLKWDIKSGALKDTIYQVIDKSPYQDTRIAVIDTLIYFSYNRDNSPLWPKGIIVTNNNQTVYEFENEIYSFTISHNGNFIIVGGGQLAYSESFPDGTFKIVNELKLFECESGKLLRKFDGHTASIYCVDFSPDDQTIVSASQDNSLILWDIGSGKIIKTFADPDQYDMTSVCFSPDGKYILSGSSNSYVSLWDVETGNLVKTFLGHQGSIVKVLFSKDGQLAFSASEDNTIKIWNVVEGTNLATLIPLPDGEWVVTNPDGLFDASPGAMKMIYYVAGMETIDLDQLKTRYYQPGLLQILLGYRDEPLRDVQGLNEIELYPSSKLQINDNKLEITLENRGGGIGQVALYLDGAEKVTDLRPVNFNPDTSAYNLTFDLAKLARSFNYDTTNVLSVITWNKEGYLRSRHDTVHFVPKGAWGHGGMEAWEHGGMVKERKNPRLFALVAGTADYYGDKIDLRFAGKDAAEFAYALELGAEGYFGTGNVFISLFTTDSSQSFQQPTKANIDSAFSSIAGNIEPSDYFVVYLAGHGINTGGPNGDFLYLTRDAYDTDPILYKDPGICKTVTISAGELTDLINMIDARKKVLILDVCAAGRAAEQITTGLRDVPGNVTRVIDNMQDRTGIYILAGCEADAVSYETSVYGQGLLTYSLLSAMKGNALKLDGGEEYVDVNTLLQYARDRVPEMTGNGMQRQTPFIKVPENDMGYYIGRMTDETKKMIRLSQPKPVFTGSRFTMADLPYDKLRLEDITDKKLVEMTAAGKDAQLVFSAAAGLPDSYSLSGSYAVSGERVTITWLVLYNQEPVTSPILITGSINDLDLLARDIIFRAYREIRNK